MRSERVIIWIDMMFFTYSSVMYANSRSFLCGWEMLFVKSFALVNVVIMHIINKRWWHAL